MMRRMLTWCMALALLIFAMPTALAATGQVTYNGSAGKFIFAPGSNHSPTDLFPDLKGVMPGDTITQGITVKNAASNRVKIRLYLRATGAHEDSEEFLSQLQLTVRNNTGTILFDAPADETTGLSSWTYLGTLYSGGTTELSVTLKVPLTLDNRFQNAVGKLDWEFMVEELPIESTDPQPPKTGDTILPYILTLAASGAVIVLLLVAEKKKRSRT